MAADHTLDKVLSVILRKRFPEIKQISAIQKQALYAIFNGRDVFAILPTGYGKSLTFQLLPDLYREFPPLPQFSERQVDNPIVLIICPLKSLVESHIRELITRGASAVSLTGDSVDVDGILKGEYSFVFGTPEALLNNEQWRSMLKSDVYQNSLIALVTDEAHVIPKWLVQNFITGITLCLVSKLLCYSTYFRLFGYLYCNIAFNIRTSPVEKSRGVALHFLCWKSCGCGSKLAYLHWKFQWVGGQNLLIYWVWNSTRVRKI
jgi:hypothetical protein